MNSRLSSVVLAAGLALLLNACSSSPKIKGVPSNLPSININGSANTPSHNMARADYPFDSNGNYVTAWAAEGGTSAGPSDYRSSTPRRSSSSTSSSRKSTSSTKARTSKTSSTASRRHTVKSGDSLWSIARKYGSSVAKIKSANGLKSDTIRDGRSLVIPR